MSCYKDLVGKRIYVNLRETTLFFVHLHGLVV